MKKEESKERDQNQKKLSKKEMRQMNGGWGFGFDATGVDSLIHPNPKKSQ